MRLRFAGLKIIVVSIALCAGILVGSYGVNLALAKGNNENNNLKPQYQINESGQTYGSAMGVAKEDKPDLIWARGSKGESGYVKKDDLESDLPKTPEEAVQMTQRNKNKSTTIPLYDKDGRTAIGSFFIDPSSAVENNVVNADNTY